MLGDDLEKVRFAGTLGGYERGAVTEIRTISPGHGDPAADRLLRRFAEQREPEIRRQLVERYLPLARYAASRYAKGPEPLDDLVQVACIGLLKALDRYDPNNGAAFSSFALPTMTGELRRHFRDRSWAVRPPRDLQEQALAVENAVDQLRSEHGTAPTIDDVARVTGLSTELVLEAREALGGRHATSLSAGLDGDNINPGLERRLGTVDGGFDSAEQRATIERLATVLTRREREIIRLRFEEDLTQTEIGAAVGISQMHVSRMLRVALEKMRSRADRAGVAA
jgi:RNA polymerase sigma-B factor